MIPFFFFKLKSSLKDPFFFYSPHQATPYFSIVLTERPHFFLYLVCHRKTPTFGVVSAHPRHYHIWVPPRSHLSTKYPPPTTWCHFNRERALNFDPMKIWSQSIDYGGTPLNNPHIEIHTNSSMFALIFWPHVTIFCIFWLHECLEWRLEFNSKSLFLC